MHVDSAPACRYGIYSSLHVRGSSSSSSIISKLMLLHRCCGHGHTNRRLVLGLQHTTQVTYVLYMCLHMLLKQVTKYGAPHVSDMSCLDDKQLPAAVATFCGYIGTHYPFFISDNSDEIVTVGNSCHMYAIYQPLTSLGQFVTNYGIQYYCTHAVWQPGHAWHKELKP